MQARYQMSRQKQQLQGNMSDPLLPKGPFPIYQLKMKARQSNAKSRQPPDTTIPIITLRGQEHGQQTFPKQSCPH
jgi:hypothetical protein